MWASKGRERVRIRLAEGTVPLYKTQGLISAFSEIPAPEKDPAVPLNPVSRIAADPTAESAERHIFDDSPSKMEPQPGCSYYDTGYSNLGVYKDLYDATCTLTSTILTEGEKETRAELQQGAAAGYLGAGVLGLLVDESLGDSGRQELEPRQEPRQEEPAAPAAVEPQPSEERKRRLRVAYTPSQVQELESVFHHVQYPGLSLREELARRLNLTDIRVQVWFQNRRAKWRRHQRALQRRNIPPVTMGQPVEFLNGPYNAMPVLEPTWTCVPLLPCPPGPSGLPVPQGLLGAPRPPSVPVPPTAPVPPFGLASGGMAWAPVVNGQFTGSNF
ncbi:homeobox protein ESX1 [Dasypus novemcinctus]|uniref:homeobox protein ESX1 n=1 Tax=Dasypus novemcinctus TaxID=9361 RepID=UPI000C862F48|nr:homeobox protein ESX1 [Dasypus novemcinctus]